MSCDDIPPVPAMSEDEREEWMPFSADNPIEDIVYDD
jgi:hypothetical protein